MSKRKIPTSTANMAGDRTCHDGTEIVQPPKIIVELKRLTTVT